MNSFSKKITSIVLILVLVLSNTSIFASNFSDIGNHWAQDIIQKWIDKGLVNGFDDGTFKPDRTMTRAEFVCMVNRAMNYTAEASISFDDVSEKDWFYKDVRIAKAQGYINGQSESLFAPNSTISRQEAVAILIRIYQLQENTDVSMFSDKEDISSWAKGYVGAAAEVQYISGYEDGTVRPQLKLKRAEALKMLDSAIFSNNVIVSKNRQKVADKEIQGNIIITKAIGDGTVYVENCKVLGSVIINGGGGQSVYFTKCTLNDVLVNKKGVHTALIQSTASSIIINKHSELTVDKDSSVQQLTLNSSGLVDNKGNVGTVNVKAEDVVLTGTFNTINTDEGVSAPKVVSGGSSGGGGGSSSGGSTGGSTNRMIQLSINLDSQQSPISVNVVYNENDNIANVYNSLKSDTLIQARFVSMVRKLQNVQLNGIYLFSQSVYDKVAEMLEIDTSSTLYSACMPSDFEDIKISDISKFVDNMDELADHISDPTVKAAILRNIAAMNLNDVEVTRDNRDMTASDIAFTIRFGNETFTQESLQEMFEYITNNIDMLTGPIDDLTIQRLQINVQRPENLEIIINK